MPTFNITARKTSPVTMVTVEADSRELAIAQVVESAAEGEQVEVMQCEDMSAGVPPAGGATGASGPASRK